MNNNDKHSVIYDLTAKKLSGEISPEEQKALDQDLSISEENKNLHSDLEWIWDKSAPSIEVDTNSAWEKLSEKISEDKEKETPIIEISPTRTFQWMSIAATLLLAIGIFSLYKLQQVDDIIYTASKIEEITLPDGSIVNLKKNTTITYPEKFTALSREINLEGEAFFDVERNEKKPFVIHTNSIDVKVLGTSFFVNTNNSNETEVNVKSGKVLVTDIANDKNKVVLQKNENIVFDKNKRSFKNKELEENKLFWKTKTLIFKRTMLQEVVNVVNLNYNKNVVIENEIMKNCKLTVTFKNKSFEEIMEVIKATFNASTEHQQNQILLKGESCE